jgi:tape measure domain-containing protein
MGKSLFNAEASFENLLRGLASTSDGSETLRAELAALQEVAKMPGLGFREAIQGATALKGAKLSAQEAREALVAFGNALTNAGKGKAELNDVLLSIQSMISTNQVDMENLKEIATRIPGFLELAARVPKGNALDWVRGIIKELKTLPQAAESAQDKVDNLADALDQKKLGMTGGKAAGIVGALTNEAMRMLQGGDVSFAGLTEAVSGEDLISKYQPTEAELARRKKVREELAAAEQEQARLAKQKVKDEEAAEKLKKGTPVREAAQQNLDVLRLRAAGRNQQADKLEQQQETARRAKELEDAGMDPAQATAMAGEESRLKKAMASGRRTTYRGESATGFRGLAANRELAEKNDRTALNEEWVFPGLDSLKAMQSRNTLKPQASARAAGAANAAAGDPVSKAVTFFAPEIVKKLDLIAAALTPLAPLPVTKLP